jgi:hypothetical protein
MEAQDRSNLLFSRNSGQKTASHFSWNCSGQAQADHEAAASLQPDPPRKARSVLRGDGLRRTAVMRPKETKAATALPAQSL